MQVRLATRILAAAALVVGIATAADSQAAGASTPRFDGVKPNAYGNLDCNGLSRIQQPVRADLACADVHDGTQNDGRFADNGVYIGHDEPDLNFTSAQAGSGDNFSWTFAIGKDPAAAPTGTTPGSDVSHYFELTPAVWFSMNLCDPHSYPQTACRPESDSNAPTATKPGGGNAFMELQFYPPGFGPWVDAPSFDNTHWGAALTIDSLEATAGFKKINPDCTEPANVAFITRDGVPPGPPSPQLFDLASATPNADTLLMNPGDTIRVRVFDAPVPHSHAKAVETVIDDLTTGESGFMQASAKNGFMNTNVNSCKGTPFNFQPEYNTAKATNVSPWGAGTEVISASFETGHWEPCTSLSQLSITELAPGVVDPYYSQCSGPYEDAAPGGDGGNVEPSDAFCFPAGDTHNGLASGFPDTMTGCEDNLVQNGDLDFDGSPYWTEWPTSATPGTHPGSFEFLPPTTGASNSLYSDYQYQTDAAFSELVTCNPSTPGGCTVPPPGAPGNFYPYWTLQHTTAAPCLWAFGNVSTGDTSGKDAQYGGIISPSFPDLVGPFKPLSC